MSKWPQDNRASCRKVLEKLNSVSVEDAHHEAILSGSSGDPPLPHVCPRNPRHYRSGSAHRRRTLPARMRAAGSRQCRRRRRKFAEALRAEPGFKESCRIYLTFNIAYATLGFHELEPQGTERGILAGRATRDLRLGDNPGAAIRLKQNRLAFCDPGHGFGFADAQSRSAGFQPLTPVALGSARPANRVANGCTLCYR